MLALDLRLIMGIHAVRSIIRIYFLHIKWHTGSSEEPSYLHNLLSGPRVGGKFGSISAASSYVIFWPIHGL